MKPTVRWRFHSGVRAWTLAMPGFPIEEAYDVPDDHDAYLFATVRWPAEVKWRAMR